MKQLLQQLVLYTWISLCVLTFILGILQIYAYHRFTTIQHLVIIQKRYPTIVKVEAIAAVFLAFITIPIWSNDSFKATNFGIEGSEEYLYEIGTILTVLNMHFIADIEVGRLWLISFNLHYLHASKNQQWKSQIDSSFSDNNWYLSNKNTYGNQRYIFKRVFTYYLCVTTLSIISFFTIGTTHYHIAQFIDSIFYSIPLFLLLHTYYKCPKHTECNDLFLFHYEFRCAVIIFIVCMIVFLLIMVLNYFQITFWVSVISTLNASIPLVLPSLLSTLWIPIKIISQSVWGIQLDNRNSNISMMHVIQLHGNNTNKQQCIDTKLKNILLNEEKFESFVSWVYREFSGEIILSFCEFVQFKHCIMN
eukprot:81933_1